MDAQNIITAFISSANQYSLCQTDNNLMNLQRHLEILLLLTSNNTDYFRSFKSLASQCIIHITNILLDGNVKISLIPRVLTILQNLAKDFVIKKQLQSTFHVHSAVSVFLQNYGSDFKDNLVLQCFYLLENITYGITIDYLESHLEHLINVLLNIVDKEPSECLEISLHLLANLCRHNLKVQKYVSGLANVKQIIKKLVSMLRKQESHIVLYTLAILGSLTPSNSILSKLWTEEHLKMTFELILKLLFEEDTNCALAALDLFTDLSQDERTMRIAALALTSTNVKHINSALSLVLLSKCNDTFTVLSENLSQRNSNMQRRMSQSSELLDSMVSLNENYVQPSKKILYSSANTSSELKLDSVLNKIETGLNIKDLKRSEIMDLYEHKIAILTRKEKELQNYVDAKTCALQEADRVMAQYKCRQADADAEAWALRNMLKDLEYRYEKASSQLEEYQLKQKKLENDLEKAWQTSSELQKSISDQKEIMHTQMTRLADQKKMVEEERTKLVEQNAFKEQEKKNLKLQIQQCEDELKTKHKAYKELEEKHEELGKSLEETKKTLEKLKINYEQKQQDLERIITEAEQKISTLEEKNEALVNEMAEKQDDFTHKISALMIKNDEQCENIKCKDLKIAELNESLRKLNDAFDKKCSSISELTKSNKQLQASIEEAEEFKENLNKEVEMLQLLCKRYERTLDKKEVELKNTKDELAKSTEEKNSRIKHLEEELDKHEYIKTMIHQMTSGRGGPPKT
ncbi:protein CIP2A homolog [Uloborus diversus]|uniref:protein CIP2A homolog n=1 Tax=Uloborus diversus TaxID=327109 RepID=UPI0024098FA7|nr:protein CIP2A homolog [Uloborus diversus]